MVEPIYTFVKGSPTIAMSRVTGERTDEAVGRLSRLGRED